MHEYDVTCDGEGNIIENFEMDYVCIETGDRCNCIACAENDEYFEERLRNYF